MVESEIKMLKASAFTMAKILKDHKVKLSSQECLDVLSRLLTNAPFEALLARTTKSLPNPAIAAPAMAAQVDDVDVRAIFETIVHDVIPHSTSFDACLIVEGPFGAYLHREQLGHSRSDLDDIHAMRRFHENRVAYEAAGGLPYMTFHEREAIKAKGHLLSKSKNLEQEATGLLMICLGQFARSVEQWLRNATTRDIVENPHPNFEIFVHHYFKNLFWANHRTTKMLIDKFPDGDIEIVFSPLPGWGVQSWTNPKNP